MPSTPRQIYNQRLQALQAARAPFDEKYEQIAKYLSPWRTRFNEGDRRKRDSNDSILDPTGRLASNACSAGISAALVSAARVWFRFGVPAQLLAVDSELGKRPVVKRYLADTEEVMRDLLLRSNFYGVTSGSAIRDLVDFGLFGSFIEEDLRSVARLKPMPLGQYWIAVNARGDVDTAIRRFSYTVRQMVQEFGLDACSPTVRDQYRRRQYDVEHVLHHVVEPNVRDETTGFEGARAGRWDWQGMDFRSVWYERGNDTDVSGRFLRTSGFREFPGVFPVWSKTSPEDVYGIGLGDHALPDIKMLQTLKRRLLQLVDKSSSPPLKGAVEAGQYPSQLPGAFTKTPGTGGSDGKLEPIYTPNPGAIEQVRQEISEVRWAIREALMADLWRILTDDERAQRPTAEEVRAQKEEKLQLLGPPVGNIEGGYLRASIDRLFAMADRAGMLPEPPPELEGAELKVEFLSIFGEAQKALEIPAIERFVNFVKALADVDPEIIDAPDADKFADKYAEVVGLPPDLLRSPDARRALREARAQQKQAEQAGQAMAVAGSAARDLAAAPMEEDSALTRIVNAFGPVAAAQSGVAA